MQHFFGIILRGSEDEIIDDERIGKGSYLGLEAVMADARKRMKQNPNIRQINIYRTDRIFRGFKDRPDLQNLQGERMLVHQLFAEPEASESSS